MLDWRAEDDPILDQWHSLRALTASTGLIAVGGNFKGVMRTNKSSPAPTTDRVPELVSAATLAARFGLTRRGVRALPIPRVKFGKRAIRYRVSDVEAFIQNADAATGTMSGCCTSYPTKNHLFSGVR
jgi:hypothetical protein